MQVKWNICGHDYFRYSYGICDKNVVSACSSVLDELWVVLPEWQASFSSYVFIPGKECVSLTYICCFIYLFCSIVCFWAFSLLPWHSPNDLDNLLLSAFEMSTWRPCSPKTSSSNSEDCHLKLFQQSLLLFFQNCSGHFSWCLPVLLNTLLIGWVEIPNRINHIHILHWMHIISI